MLNKEDLCDYCLTKCKEPDEMNTSFEELEDPILDKSLIELSKSKKRNEKLELEW